MPIYDYGCQECGKLIEKLEKYGIQFIECPFCGARAEKVLSAPSFSIGGDGVYKPGFSSNVRDVSGK